MTSKSEIGKLGEDLACRYLVKSGYRVIDRNYRQTYGELDIVCRETSGELVLVEVKTVSGDDLDISAEDQMTVSKLNKFKRIALAYANEFLCNEPGTGFRLDLLAVNLNGNSCRIRHYKNIS